MPLYQYSRDLDPIVGVSFTGWFDFCVNALGAKWLQWFTDDRPEFYPHPTIERNVEKICLLLGIFIDDYELIDESGWNLGMLYRDIEVAYLTRWRETAEKTVRDYCDRHELKRPNRCTTVQPAGSKSLLTGASPGWHPPKAQWFIRRITIGKNNPIALAAIDCGYTIVPAQSDKDENGRLLDDPFDERCTEWLIEIPTAVNWADIPGVEKIDISQFSATAQLDYCMTVQKHYTRHNTSATIELREHEIDDLAQAIYDAIQNDDGYVSVAILARFDDLETYPRLPFEPISKQKYVELWQGVLDRRTSDDFYTAISKYSSPEEVEGPAGCDSDKCLLPIAEKN